MTLPLLPLDWPPYRLSGVVYSALLNHAPQLAALGQAAHQPPYKAPPQAPVLALRPRNALAGDGASVAVPADAAGVLVGVSLGIVIGRTACRVPLADALQVVAGYTLVNDLCLPSDHPSPHYRPGVRLRARDNFCIIGPGVLPAAALPHPDALSTEVSIDGQVVQRGDTGQRVRGVAQLVADVTEFMTLQPGDLLLLGVADGAPLARPGQAVAVHIAGLGSQHCRVVAEPPAPQPTGDAV